MKFTVFPSLLRLTLLGFVLVSLPLVASIVTAIGQVERLAEDSLRGMMAVQGGTASSRLLAERATSVERSARQYQALKDPLFESHFQQHRDAALAQLEQLEAGAHKSAIARSVATARNELERVTALVESVGTTTTEADLNAALTDLREAIQAIVQEQSVISREMAAAFPLDALELRRTLIGQAALVIPVSAGLAVLFGIVIARPIRRIGSAIQALGRNELGRKIDIGGPEDLRRLGQRLEWLRQRLVELEAQKAQFLRNVSHELKTPLTNIREGAELLRGEQAGIDEETREVAHIVRENSIRLQKMIEELLRYGSESDMLADAPDEPVRLDKMVREVLETHQSRAQRRSVEIRRALEPVRVTGNPERLRVIVGNLLSNAMNYAPDGGWVEVQLSANAAEVRLDVRDNGPGVAEQDVPHLFEWFHAGAKPPGAIVAGTGMGLAIAQEYAEQTGGHIEWLPSNGGAHFRATFRRTS